MSEYQADSNIGLNQPIAENSSTLQDVLGREICALDMASTEYGPGTFIYLKGVASTVVGSAVTFNRGDHQTALAVADAVGCIGIAMSACVANEYGWYQIVGRAVCKVAASFADDTMAYLTSTAGTLDDAVVAGDAVQKSFGHSDIDTPSTGLAEIAIDRPFVNNITN